jgi:hypothetical protein
VQVVATGVAPLIKTSKIGPAVDLDVLLLLLVHEFMEGNCPVLPLEQPRRITDGRMPTLTNLGGAALSRHSVPASGVFNNLFLACCCFFCCFCIGG